MQIGGDCPQRWCCIRRVMHQITNPGCDATKSAYFYKRRLCILKVYLREPSVAIAAARQRGAKWEKLWMLWGMLPGAHRNRGLLLQGVVLSALFLLTPQFLEQPWEQSLEQSLFP